jgi:hypothetical protein
VGPQCLLVELGARRELDRGNDQLPAPLQRLAEHGGVDDIRVETQHRLDLRGRDVESAGDDEFLGSVHDGSEAVLVDGHDVAGAQPAAGQEGLRGLLRVVPIALEDLRALQQQLARLARRHLSGGVVQVDDQHPGRGEGHADRAGAAGGMERVAERDRGRLGHAVALHEQSARYRFPQLHDMVGQVHRARDAELA